MADDTDLGTSSRQIDWVALVVEADGPDYLNPEHDAYQFSKKTFKETDGNGVYDG